MLESKRTWAVNDSVSIEREDGQSQRIAAMSSRITPGKSMMINVMITDQIKAASHQDLIAEKLTSFVEEARTMARENGVPV